ncbi:hypothetical protein IMCC26256_111663 [Actinobacteria bacterium IMCC26256]|nr:hypothetical protein IMCC26256_111663 [Actinobacteria bacterium IMCC26256]
MEPISRDDSPAAGKSGRAKKATRRKILIAAAVVIVIAIGIAAVPKSGGDNSARSGSYSSDTITASCGDSNDMVGSTGRVKWTVGLNTDIARVQFRFVDPDGVATFSGVATTLDGNRVFYATYELGAQSVNVDLYASNNALLGTKSAKC